MTHPTPVEPVLSYVNARGKLVNVSVSKHAMKRFIERYWRVYPAVTLGADAGLVLANLFNAAKRFPGMARKYQSRKERHGQDTLFFMSQPFVFVVQAATLVTVELGTSDTREMN